MRLRVGCFKSVDGGVGGMLNSAMGWTPYGINPRFGTWSFPLDFD